MLAIEVLPEAKLEWDALPPREIAAMGNAILKLQAAGDQLGYPHSSAVLGLPEPLRELRPRQGSSPYRAFYCRCGHTIVVSAIGPEAKRDPNGFDRAVARALDRLSQR
ncbi:MAG: type II toxin-antitoxin system RelE/ParE family toxin [Armatimonadetes bacterium]|nr:type II toxin-antitoxin system RelE/ParE family toxin [Armatimonadota bacterium]